MDPFTQKLLERTQARKEALQQKRLAIAGVNSPSKPSRTPFTEKACNEEMNVDQDEAVELIKPINMETDLKSKKRLSTENSENDYRERKTKCYNLSPSDNDCKDGMAFRTLQPKEPYVKPCTAGRNPRQIVEGVSLKDRFAHLTKDFNTKLENDGVIGDDDNDSGNNENTLDLIAAEVQAIQDNLSAKLSEGNDIAEKKNRWGHLSEDVAARLENDKIEESKPKEQLHRDAMLQKKTRAPMTKWGASSAGPEAPAAARISHAPQAKARPAKDLDNTKPEEGSQAARLHTGQPVSSAIDVPCVVKPKPRPDLILDCGDAKRGVQDPVKACSASPKEAASLASPKEAASVVKPKPRPNFLKTSVDAAKDTVCNVDDKPIVSVQTRAQELNAASEARSKGPEKVNENSAQSYVGQIAKVPKEHVEDQVEKCSASVGDKMNIFEAKMRLEKEARQKELEAGERLRQKAPRKPPRLDCAALTAKKVSSKEAVAGTSAVHAVPESEGDDTITNEKVARQRSPIKRSGCDDIASGTPSPHKKKLQDFPVVSVEPDVPVCSPISGAHAQPHLASIQSPFSDVTVTDITEDPFDVSSILPSDHEAMRNKPVAPKPDRAAHRSSTMKVQLKSTERVVALTQIDITIDSVSEDGNDGHLRSHQADLEDREKDNQLASDSSSPVAVASEVPPSHLNFLNAKAEERGMTPSQDDMALSPNRSPAKSSRRRMRRSKSFSEGLPKRALSGCEDDETDKYGVRAVNCDLPDVIVTKQETIQDLLEEAASQQNIVLQASQALNVALSSNEDKRGLPEVVECERLLLLATEKRTACLAEVQLLKQLQGDVLPEPLPSKRGDVSPCKATISLSEIRLPLDPDFYAAINAGRDLGNFHFVVMICHGFKHVYATKAVCTYDQHEGPMLLFDSNVVMKNLSHDFQISVKVFKLHSKRQVDAVSKGRRQGVSVQSPGIMKGMFLFTPKRRHMSDHENDLAAFASPQTVFRTSNFQLVGEAKIDMSVARAGKYSLAKVPANCPLDGSIHIRVACQPEFSANVNGFLTILEDVGGYTAWNRRWCAISDHKILYWMYPDEEGVKTPLGSVDLRYVFCKRVEILARDICARPHTFELVLRRPVLKEDQPNLIATVEGKHLILKYWLCADNKEDRLNWMATINRHLSDARAWTAKKSPSGDGVVNPIAV